MKLKSAVVASLALLVSAGCSSMSVNTDYSPDASFDGLETFAWAPVKDSQGAEAQMLNQIMQRRLIDTVEQGLQAKGYRKVESNPDFYVAWFSASGTQVDAQTTYDYWGYTFKPEPNRPTTFVYEQGTLVLAMANPGSMELIWQGWASDAIDHTDPQKLEKKMYEAVEKILAGFPPER
jgi:hypothetical protein